MHVGAVQLLHLNFCYLSASIPWFLMKLINLFSLILKLCSFYPLFCLLFLFYLIGHKISMILRGFCISGAPEFLILEVKDLSLVRLQSTLLFVLLSLASESFSMRLSNSLLHSSSFLFMQLLERISRHRTKNRKFSISWLLKCGLPSLFSFLSSLKISCYISCCLLGSLYSRVIRILGFRLIVVDSPVIILIGLILNLCILSSKNTLSTRGFVSKSVSFLALSQFHFRGPIGFFIFSAFLDFNFLLCSSLLVIPCVSL